jgi:signal transduction histidine kinase/CheY-like chemotaxis protein
VALLASLLVYYAVNTATIAVAVSLYNRAPLYRVWKENFLWSAPSHFAGGSIALGMAYFIQRFGIVSLVLALPFCILIYYSYKLYMDRLFEERRHSEQMQNINLELERKVQERTRELETLNERLQSSNLELQRVSHMKSEFLANMSHELRTPLNAIIGFSELLMDQTFGQLNDAQSDYVNDILSSGRHLLELINDILDLSKIEAGKMELRPEGFDVSQLIDEALSTLQVAAARKKIELARDVPMDVHDFCADRGKVKQILHNLLSNAIKFTPEGGHVNLSCRMSGEELEVSVSDTGIGIQKEDQKRIFEAFMQVDGSYSRKYQGTGLGLTLVKRFVELHGGRLHVESDPGRGSRFTFSLPAMAPRQESGGFLRFDQNLSAPPPHSAAGTSQRRDLILVVEDNPANMKLISELLRARGFTILEAANAEEALTRVRRIKPHLILMDLQLPGMDGLACARELKKDPRTSDIPTVALTAHAMKGDEERAREAGCVGYITKPINTAEFARQIEGFLALDPAFAATVPE